MRRDVTPAPRGFPVAEFEGRVARAQARMAQAGLEALLLTTEPEIRYYTGFLTRFWESPSRPWFLVLPATGRPVAVIPRIGVELMARTWIEDIRDWPSPDPDDDGVTLLAEAIRELVPPGGRIGLADGPESHLRMPLADFERLRAALDGRAVTGDGAITRDLRMVKSAAEIDKIRDAARIAERAFARMNEAARPGLPLDTVFRRFQILCLEEGADAVPYLAGAAGPVGYTDVISPATERPLAEGDVLMLDTGLVRDGYFCDFDRNFSVGPPSPALREATGRLADAVMAGAEMARPGHSVADLYNTMARVVTAGGRPCPAGRFGHGLGQQLTEWPSILPGSAMPLVPGMVLTLEPSVDMGGGQILVHEENIVVTDGAAEFLSGPYPPGPTVLS